MNQIKQPEMQRPSNIPSSTSTSSSAWNLPMMAAASRYNATAPSVDLSEFPTLGNRVSGSNPTSGNHDWQQVAWKDASKSQRPQEPAPKFRIQQEDFPALPGAQSYPPISWTAVENGRKSPPGASGGNIIVSYEQALWESQSSGLNQRRAMELLPDGTIANIPQGMVTDQFGMAGLLTFMRTAERDPGLVALNAGFDLTTLGLNVASDEDLLDTFQSPWADRPARPQDIDCHIPLDYRVNRFTKPKLTGIKLNRYTEDLLFYLFYTNRNEVLQIEAAAELFNRDWRYHKEEKVWLTGLKESTLDVQMTKCERGTYYYFDPQVWKKSEKQMHIEYAKLEGKPQLPNMYAPSQQQQQQRNWGPYT